MIILIWVRLVRMIILMASMARMIILMIGLINANGSTALMLHRQLLKAHCWGPSLGLGAERAGGFEGCALGAGLGQAPNHEP